MSRPLHVHVLALDPAATDLGERLAEVTAVLGPAPVVTVVGPTAVPPHPHVPVAVTLFAGGAGRGPAALVVAMVRANLRSRAAWRAVRGDAAAVRTLRGADLVVVVDTVSQRAGWVLARRHGVRAVTGSRALRYALRSLPAA